jgi:hypothetical protein
MPKVTQLSWPINTRSGRAMTAAIPADLNGDGKPDLVVTRSFGPGLGELSFKMGNGDGTFTDAGTLTGTANTRIARVADLNGDNKPDVVVTDFIHTGFASVLLNNGDGTFRGPIANYPIGQSATFAVVADVNGDCKLDLLALNTRPESTGVSQYVSSNLTVLLGRGDGTFETARTNEVALSAQRFSVGDLNGDNRPDIVVADEWRGELVLFWGRGDGSFQWGGRIQTKYAPSGITIHDINRDNRADLLIGAPNGVVVYLGRGDGSFDMTSEYFTGPSRSLVTADFDHDGHLDNATGRTLLYGDGAGRFSAGMLPDSDYNDSFVVAADVNGDGWPDLVAADIEHSQIHVYMNSGVRQPLHASR